MGKTLRRKYFLLYNNLREMIIIFVFLQKFAHAFSLKDAKLISEELIAGNHKTV